MEAEPGDYHLINVIASGAVARVAGRARSTFVEWMLADFDAVDT